VLVDVDGTLVDSNYHHVIAWSRALRDHGEDARLAAIHRLVGMGSSAMLQSLIGRDDRAITTSWRQHFDDLLPEVRAFEHAADLLRALHGRGLVVVLATSSPEDLIAHFRSVVDADDAIDFAVTSSDVERAKPQPDTFEMAMREAGLHRSRVAVLGDSVWDVEAATRAGLPSVTLETGGFSRSELEAAGATAVFKDPGELEESLATSPFAALVR